MVSRGLAVADTVVANSCSFVLYVPHVTNCIIMVAHHSVDYQRGGSVRLYGKPTVPSRDVWSSVDQYYSTNLQCFFSYLISKGGQRT